MGCLVSQIIPTSQPLLAEAVGSLWPLEFSSLAKAACVQSGRRRICMCCVLSGGVVRCLKSEGKLFCRTTSLNCPGKEIERKQQFMKDQTKENIWHKYFYATLSLFQSG